MTDDQLEQRIRQVLAELATVSEAEGGSILAYSSSAGDENDIGGNRPPGPVESVADRWGRRFDEVDDDGRRRTLLLLARRELALIRRRKPMLVDEHGQPEGMLEAEGRILDWFEGVQADEAAIYESASGSFCSGNDIRRIRERNDRDKEFGRPMVPREKRVAHAHRLRASGLSIRKIALEMHVAKSTVQTWLELDDQADARKGRAA